ncbi:hypothetical protein [Stenotrophomonas sp. 24(2023)]|uniref:hypothetical protein n=1 Tax=Stenotrophomonas sp. 24(2023) TaxID=3068324 RepID=UPI0027E0D487|nr:hypothetical protein [Stenotrophomonas sp. 24(2023)]WMJ70480.1 hypothetical protein Q9R17_05095 [Stenotrophomonas sp. 24(2023)]
MLALAWSPCAPANDPAQKRAAASVASTYASLWLVASPALAISAAVDAVGTSSGNPKRPGPAARQKAQARPPLRIQEIRQQANGDYHIDVETLGHPDQHGTMLWAARPDNPATALKAGDLLALTPTAAGSGWWIHAGGDHAVAFMPTADSAQHILSESLPP